MHELCIMMHMRTTLNLRDDLIQKAAGFTKITEKTALVHAGLEALIEKHARARLAALGGTMPSAAAGRRRRSSR